jgi:hypothetical protein
MKKILLYYKKIEIIGEPEFANYIVKVLKFMNKKIPSRLKTIQKYINRIEQSSKTCQAHLNELSICYMSAKTAYYSTTWCAGSLVHEAHHAKLHLEYLKNNKTKIQRLLKVPRKISAMQKEELECIKQKLIACKKMNAPKKEIDCLKKADGLHFLKKQTW